MALEEIVGELGIGFESLRDQIMKDGEISARMKRLINCICISDDWM